MSITGLGFSYYDWYRKLALEALCEAEDVRDSVRDANKRLKENVYMKA